MSGSVRGFGGRARTGNSRGQRGAAAIEFALVVPILLALFFGILDYGMYFFNGMSTRQGGREGARLGVVATYNKGSSCTTGIPMAQLACTTDASIAPMNANVYTKIVLPAGGWVKGSELLVCTQTKSRSLTGLTPLPGGGYSKAITRMAIEVVPSSNVPTAGYTDTGTVDWSWCS